MEKELLQELKDEIELFREQTNKFIQKEISVKDFKEVMHNVAVKNSCFVYV